MQRLLPATTSTRVDSHAVRVQESTFCIVYHATTGTRAASYAVRVMQYLANLFGAIN